MLTPELIQAVGQHSESMTRDVTLVLQTGQYEQREDLEQFLSQLATASPRIAFEQRDLQLRSALSFGLEADGQSTGIVFSGIPGGHEFSSLVLAILNAGGVAPKLDDSVVAIVRNVQAPLQFETVVSLSCHNCPDVVQTLNQFAAINPSISAEMIDGGLYPDLIEERNIQGVPAVFLNGEPFANGKIDTAVILQKLMERFPPSVDSQSTREADLPLQDVTVVGGGPAGVSAAIYAARKGLAVTLVAERLGGQVKDTMGIENLISIPSTVGPDVVNGLQAHLQDYDITLKEHLRVEQIDPGAIKTVQLSSGESIRTRSVIVATGANWRELGVPGERENIGNGVAYCPHCDGPFFKGRDVAVIGGGNSGIEAAIDLSGIVGSVTVIEFLPELKADQVLVDQAMARDNIRIVTNAATQAINADNGKVTGLTYQDRESEDLVDVDVAGVFVQIGLVPNSQFLDGVVDQEPWGEIIINDKGETSEPGIFACGDVTTVPYKQIVIALGEGSKAALTAFEYLVMNPVEDTRDKAA
ncbi:MAG: alkyl hydroperoxide reductase subunit F [Xanthomonadales bacterium]|nr:alkyl hydroperoxide reductase subunit F [Xanthomonadales bacterium]